MGLAERVEFPCASMPEQPARARLLGIYPQRQESLYLQRVRLLGGRVRAEQWEGMAILARKHAPGYPLHVTTRQDVELHGIRKEDVPSVQRGLRELGLTGAGACGDTVRNITLCPSNGLRRDTWDLSVLADSIQAHVESIPWITDLPRKFKIGLCGCLESCTSPWSNDLGLVANRDGTFRAIVAGSLGTKPSPGVPLHDALRAEDVLPLVVALLRLFCAEGDRQHRHRARLRHVRERLGDEAFRQRVQTLFEEEAGRSRCVLRVWQVEEDTPLQAHLRLPLGDIGPEAAIELARTVQEADATLRIGVEHDLLVYGPNSVALSPGLEALTTVSPVIACPGSTWCAKGIVDSRDAAERIGRRLPRGANVSVAVSGCPNNCSRATLASIGLVGRVQRVDGQPVKGFRVFVGGGEGRSPELAHELHPFVPADDIDEAVARIVQEHARSHELQN